jgi:hypothetical protein
MKYDGIFAAFYIFFGGYHEIGYGESFCAALVGLYRYRNGRLACFYSG